MKELLKGLRKEDRSKKIIHWWKKRKIFVPLEDEAQLEKRAELPVWSGNSATTIWR